MKHLLQTSLNHLQSAARLLCLLLSVSLAACGWVDSTGVQNRDLPVVTFEANSVVDLIENEPMLVDPIPRLDPQGEIQAWRWSNEPVNAGNLLVCQGTNGFNPEFVQDTLEDACAEGGQCSLQFTEQVRNIDGVQRIQFELLPPVLRAPVGVSYALTGTDASGIETSNEFTFCLISVNEAPDAVDDRFTVTEGETLVVLANGPNLLSNDSDDDDASNLPLQVIVEAVTEPSFATDFTLFADGGFRYQPRPGFSGTDEFTYRVTDGSGNNTASVSLVVRPSNEPPMLVADELPEFEIIEGIPVELSLSDFFVDPEGANISFSADDLPEGLILSEEGDLGGALGDGKTGALSFNILVTDGISEISVPFIGDVAVNEPPVARSDLPDLTAETGETVRLNVAGFFSDPEEQSLGYTLRAPAGLAFSINRTSGVITGVPANSGRFELTVGVSDGFNDEVSFELQLTVSGTTTLNRRPIYTGSLGNQTVGVGTLITPVVPRFTDPDGDTLTYTLIGTRPAGLVFNAITGRLTGRPTVPGIFNSLAIRATDEGGLSTTSDTFNLRIVPAEEDEPPVSDDDDTDDDDTDDDDTPPVSVLTNRAPVVDDISNQVVSDSFTYNLRRFFDDPDGDTLTYTAVGLPPRVAISPTGIISGVASAANDGPHFIVVTASDGRGGTASDGFRLTINN